MHICKAMQYQCSGTVCLRYLYTDDYVALLGYEKEKPFNEGECRHILLLWKLWWNALGESKKLTHLVGYGVKGTVWLIFKNKMSVDQRLTCWRFEKFSLLNHSSFTSREWENSGKGWNGNKKSIFNSGPWFACLWSLSHNSETDSGIELNFQWLVYKSWTRNECRICVPIIQICESERRMILPNKTITCKLAYRW